MTDRVLGHWIRLGILLGASLLGAASAQARVERFAVIVGNNRGAAGEVDLRFAETDAERVREVLQDVGGFDPSNIVLLRSEDVGIVRRALIGANHRIRSSVAAGNQVELLVFYSGHADPERLHLGRTFLELSELEQLVHGSAATLRLLIVDACRAGELTRPKGGQRVSPIVVSVEDRLAGQGMVVLSSTAASEDAQESDKLKGSFFTHALVSGLLGAADQNGDGVVVLEEAYQYSYEATLRSTSQSYSGPQHPSFRVDLRGHDKVVLADLSSHSAERATLQFPSGRTYLVMAGSADGKVVAEVGALDASRRLALRPAKYFVRGRAPDFLLEGAVDAAAGAQLEVRDALLQRVEYARMVRKGDSEVSVVHGPQMGYRIRTALANMNGLCQGAFVGYGFELQHLSIVPRLGACHGGFENELVSARSEELGLEVRFILSWDLPLFTVDASAAIRASLLYQSFTSSGSAPSRLSAAGGSGLGVGLSRDLVAGLYLFAELEGQVYVFRMQQSPNSTNTVASFAVAPTVGLGKRW
ncbi:MAG: caspase family protein [Deltaproteobacteria bacterium]|nr:caspase family protein [Deltaproteobacteria bacterium]